MRGSTVKTWQSVVRTRKGSFSGKIEVEFKEGDFQVGLEKMWRLTEDIEDQGENMYSHVSWYHSQHKGKKKYPAGL